MSAADVPRKTHADARASMSVPPPVHIGELLDGCQRVVVVAPHPDDETLGVGGLLATLLRRNFPLRIIMVTDGEAGHTDGGAWTPQTLRTARPLECVMALRQLGWARPRVQRLRLPDSDVAAHEDTLARRLEPLLRAGDRVLTTWQHDGHPDHEATARAVIQVAAARRCACAQFPVWSRSQLLHGDDDRARGRVRRFDLDSATLRRKCRAVKAYRSQLVVDAVSGAGPIIAPDMVQRFLVPFEVLVL